ncbi:MAG TPA: nitroreductase/quinone reductase family protein [Croceibacterium sp.]
MSHCSGRSTSTDTAKPTARKATTGRAPRCCCSPPPGRNSGAKRTTPPIYHRHGDDYLVVASNGGDPPGWFLNLQDDPIVAVQVKADHHTARARVATAEEKPELWRIMTATGAPYDEFQAKADREIPVVVLEPG